MVRDFDDELVHRQALRKKYLENPNYRRWSDVVPGGIGGRQYMTWRDDRLFDYLITNQIFLSIYFILNIYPITIGRAGFEDNISMMYFFTNILIIILLHLINLYQFKHLKN